jgi:hypothetical protein
MHMIDEINQSKKPKYYTMPTVQHSEKGKTLVTVKIHYFIFENVEK